MLETDSTPAIELTIVVPTFNERENVALLVERLDRALGAIAWEAVFVDDDSPDGTAAAVRALAGRDRRVRIIERIGRRGLSSACVEGILSSSAPFAAVIDADLQHDETILPDMLRRAKADALDLVVASRYVEGGSTAGWSAHRLAISRLSVRVARSLFGVALKDPMSGFFLVRRTAFDLAVRRLSQQGFKILFDLVASSPRPLRFAEIPYRFATRQHGASKLDSMVAWQFGLLLLDKLFGRFVPVRFVMFSLVGGSGILVHLAVLFALVRAQVPFTRAQVVAVVAAMTSNFLLNNVFTYRDQRLRGFAALRGLATFYGVCGLGALANIGVASVLYAQHPTWWLAGLAGAIIGAVWNYAASRLFTWGNV